MSHYQEALKYAEVSANSAGTATEKYGAYLDGVEAHANSLKAVFESFSATLLKSDALTGIIDAGSVILGILDAIVGNGIIQWVGALNSALVITAGILGSQLAIGANVFQAAIAKMLVKMGMLQGAAIKTSMALGLMLPVLGAILAIKAFNALNVTLEEQQDKLAEIQTEYQGVSGEIDNLSGKLANGSITPYEQARLTFLQQYKAELLSAQDIQERAVIKSAMYGTGGVGSGGLIGEVYGMATVSPEIIAQNAISGGKTKKAKAGYDQLTLSLARLYEIQSQVGTYLDDPSVIADPEMLRTTTESFDFVTAQITKYQSAIDTIVNTGLVPYAEEVADANSSVADSTEQTITTFVDFQSEVTTVIAKSSALSSALQQQATDGYLSEESLKALTEAGVKYSATLDESSGKYTVNAAKLQESLDSTVSLERALLKLREAKDLETLAQMESSDASETDIANMKLQLAQYEALDRQLIELMSSMSDYKAAIETANASSDFDYATGDMLGTITSGLESGRVATDEFKAAMAYFTDGSFGNALTQDSIPAMKSFFDGISKYTQGGAAGLNAATEAFKGLLDANGRFLKGTTLEDAANALGENVGTEFTYGLLKSYEDYGFEINLEEIMRPEDWAAVAGMLDEQAQNMLDSEKKLGELLSGPQTEESQNQIRNILNTLPVEDLNKAIADYQSALDSGEYKGRQKQNIEDNLASLNLLLDKKEAFDNEIEMAVQDNASPVLEDIIALLAKIQNKTVVIGVTWKVGGAVGGLGAPDNPLAGGIDTVSVGGLGKASGNANAGGTWGRGPGGKTLVGELGREIVVNPATNRWYTVGDNGAQFVNLPQNAIVFNHQQSKSILSQGRLGSRGKALSGGNAAYNRFTDDADITFGSYNGTYMVTSDGIKPIPTSPTAPKPSNPGPSAPSIAEVYQKEIKLLEHQAKLIGDMLNMYAEGSDAWFEQQQNIIDTYKKSAELTEAEYWRLHALSGGVITDDMQKLMESLVDYKKEVFDASKQYWEAEKDNASDTLEYLKSQAQAVIDLKTSYHELTKSIQSEQREIDNQLKIAAEAYPNLTEAERAAAFSGDDYQELSRRLNAISAEAQTMYTSYLEQIQNVGEDASYELETITSEFERQYDLKLDQYNIAKAELGVLKARKNLENVQNERSVAMLIGGLWTWVADSDNVISAMESLSSAEQDLADAQSDASFNADKANWEGYISSIDNQIGAIDALVYTMDDLAAEIHDLVDGVQAQIQMALSASTNSLFSSLPNYTGTSNALFNTANLQNLWTASVNNAIAGSGQTISTNTLIGELLANMASYGSATPPATNNGDVLMWNGNVVAQGNDVTALINILRSLVPIFPVDN